MRDFSSYGPVNADQHFCVERPRLVEECVNRLVGRPSKGGHYFTMWASPQTGVTWLVRRAMEEIRKRYGDRFVIGTLSMQGLKGKKEAEARFFDALPRLFREGFRMDLPPVKNWEEWMGLFRKDGGAFDRPLLLLLDEFDSLDNALIDHLVGLFRQIYLARDAYCLHGLALIGVRAVLGTESDQGSPFNVQRSLHVSNFTFLEVQDLFQQYREESGQVIEPEVVEKVYESVQGQPGLTCWFGELLTQKYNPATRRAGQVSVEPLAPIGMAQWRLVYARALHTERNNNILNLEAKARAPYAREVHTLFVKADVPFSVGQPWCDYLELNGIIREKAVENESANAPFVCRFASPFVQRRLFNAFTEDFYGSKGPILALEPGDLLDDVFSTDELRLPPLLDRYKMYLERLKTRKINPWEGQPRRKTDLALSEAVAHFHLYAWMREAIGHRSVISPEFPTGNGKVDLVVRHEDRLALIEVKSFRDSYELRRSYGKAAEYARQLGLRSATLAVFVPVHDEKVLEQISGDIVIDGVRVVTVAIGWG